MKLSAQQFRDRTGLDATAIAQTLEHAAKASAAATLGRFRTPLVVDNKHKEGFDPVTDADRESEQVIRDHIAARFPDHALIGEEQDDVRLESPYAWIMDPIDGTRSYISGVPLWGTLIGFAHKGEALAGVMHQPFTGETFLGAPGGALYKRGDEVLPMSTSGCVQLAEARLFCTAPELFDTNFRQAAWDAIKKKVRLLRYGTDCYGYALLAAGHADLVVEPRLNIYDIAPLIPVIEQAGGVVARWDGGPADQGGDVVAAATRQLLEQALDLINRAGA